MATILRSTGGGERVESRRPRMLAWLSQRLRGGLLNTLSCFYPTGDDAGRDSYTPTSLVLRAGATSIKGNHRASNQDRCYCDCGLGVFMVADGMGGRRGGELASRIAVEQIPWRLAVLLPDDVTDFSRVKSAIETAFDDARRHMQAHAHRHSEFGQMGTAVALTVLIDDVLYIAHAGDCRVYHQRGRELRRMTADHTLVQSMAESGVITEAEAQVHPWRHQVVNWLGVKPSHRPPDVTAMRLQPGDRCLLTSDGLTGVVDDEQIRRILCQDSHPQHIAQQLVGQAVVNHSRDNISCVVVDFIAVPEDDASLDWEDFRQVQPMIA